jgi:hypothetical protein
VRDYFKYTENPEKRIAKQFEREVGYPLNLSNPETFNEKLNWLKVHYRNPLMPVCSDKYLVREYVENKKLGHILVPLLGAGDCFNELKWETLPDEFVLKTNHNSGGVWIIKNKTEVDTKVLGKEIDEKLSKKFGRLSHEWHYLDIKPKVLAEQYLADKKGELLDYKFFCFNGEPRYIQIDFDRFTNHTRTYYDLNWKNLRFSTGYPVSDREVERPKKFNEMFDAAKALSSGFPHVRVDLYHVNDRVYFGELTFFHEAGFKKFSDFEWDRKMGNLLQLP